MLSCSKKFSVKLENFLISFVLKSMLIVFFFLAGHEVDEVTNVFVLLSIPSISLLSSVGSPLINFVKIF